MKPWIVAMTGASGAVYGVTLVQKLTESGQRVVLLISEPARLVIREELGVQPASFIQAEALEAVFGPSIRGKVEIYSPRDFTAAVASGSYPTEGMVIAPCSMGTLGAVASGLSQNLIHRAADCILKEGRRLVLVPRETPLSAIHLENMLKLSRLGVRMVPAMPGFYSGVQNLNDLVDFMVGKILDQMDVVHTLYPRWTGPVSLPAGTAFSAAKGPEGNR